MVHAYSKVEAPRIVDGKPMHIVGVSKVYAQQERSAIPDQWKRFAPEIGKTPGQPSKVAYGIMFDAAGGFEYMTGVEVSAASTASGDLKQITLPALKYAVFPHKGDASTLWQTADAAYRNWLPSSGHELADRPKLIERYGEKFDPATKTGDIEIWLPLKS
jgi:AraC family transcriptional regulator